MRRRIIKGNGENMTDLPNLFCKRFRHLISDVGYHDIFRGIGDKVLFHNGQTAPRFCFVRQKCRKIGINPDFTERETAVNSSTQEEKNDYKPPANNARGYLMHDIWFLRNSFHVFP